MSFYYNFITHSLFVKTYENLCNFLNFFTYVNIYALIYNTSLIIISLLSKNNIMPHINKIYLYIVILLISLYTLLFVSAMNTIFLWHIQLVFS